MMAFGINSDLMTALSQIQNGINLTAWSIETGQVTNQSFAGGAYKPIVPILQIQDISPQNSSVSVNATQNTDGKFSLTYVGFGVTHYNYLNVPSSAYYQPPLIMPTAVVFANNFRGLGLPSSYWYDLVSLMLKINTLVTEEMTCNSLDGGYCVLSQSCAMYPVLWEYTFKVVLTGAGNYILVPLSAFAVETSSATCNLYITSLGNTDYIIAGSMFLQ